MTHKTTAKVAIVNCKLFISKPAISHVFCSRIAKCCANKVKQTHRLIKKLNAKRIKPVELNRISNFCKLSGVPSVKNERMLDDNIVGSNRFASANNKKPMNNKQPNTHLSVSKIGFNCVGTSLISVLTTEKRGKFIIKENVFVTVST